MRTQPVPNRFFAALTIRTGSATRPSRGTLWSAGLLLFSLLNTGLHFALPASARAQVSTAPSSAASADAEAGSVYIKVGEANLSRSLLAMPPLQFQGTPAVAKNHIRAGKELFDVISNDLNVSGYFDIIRPQAYLEDTTKVGLRPAPGTPGGFDFEKWKPLKTQFLIRTGYKIIGDEITLEAYVYFVPQAKGVLAKTYKGSLSALRTVAHTFANDVLEALTGKSGPFLSKIAASRTTAKGQKEIFVMDWDGAEQKRISNHKSIAISPAWSPDGRQIAYTAAAFHAKENRRNWDLFTYELASGRRWLVSFRKGINSGASFTPDGRNILFTISSTEAGGTSDIYRMTIDGKKLTAMTKGPRGALNVEPSMSPDGSKIAFSSDRSGCIMKERSSCPMIFIMNADGSNIVRKTFAGEYNSTPRWSPDGRKLVFAGQDKGHFDIFVMDADGTNMARLTSARKPNGKMADNEEPSFSPDGRYVLFLSNRTGLNQLYIVSVDGENERRITFDRHEYFKPVWSPALD